MAGVEDQGGRDLLPRQDTSVPSTCAVQRRLEIHSQQIIGNKLKSLYQ